MSGLEENVRAALARQSAPWAAEALPAAGLLARHLELLLEANDAFNLVSRTDASPGRLVARHLVDSLRALPFLPRTGASWTLVDVGSGGGFPAIPLLAVRPDLRGVLVESTGKKARFLEAVIRGLGLTARVVNARFPAPALDEMSDLPPVDLLTSRAVADSGKVVRQARRILAPGARALLWTVEPLVARILRQSGGAVRFERGDGEQGIAVVECFT